MGHDILIVDDERDICTLIAGILEDEGHAPRRAHNSTEAVAVTGRSSPYAGCSRVTRLLPDRRSRDLDDDLDLHR